MKKCFQAFGRASSPLEVTLSNGLLIEPKKECNREKSNAHGTKGHGLDSFVT